MNRVINNDQVSKIRVLSWNINGLGNKMTDPDLFTFISNYDIIFFIETMKGNDFTLAIPGYKFHHVSRKLKHKNACRASGGIGILISNKHADLTRINYTYDYLVWLTLATDCCQKNIKIGCTYIPPENLTYVGVRNDYFTMLEEEVARYIETHHILLCGDFKSRTSQAPDNEAGVIDTYVTVPNRRSNEDKVINKYGQLLLKFCINTGFKIANGRMYNDNGIGRFTYYSPNGSSTIDYLILNEDNSKFEVLPKLVESDHCPIQFNISNTKLDDHDDYNPLKIDTCVNDKDSCSNVFIWQDEKKQEYQLALRNEQTCHAFAQMLCAVIDGCNTDTLCDMFNGMIENVILPIFPARKHISKQRKNTQNNFPSNPSYDKECKSFKYVVNNIAKQRDFNGRHGGYNIMLRQYKQLIQRKKRQYQQATLSELENRRTEDPNSY